MVCYGAIDKESLVLRMEKKCVYTYVYIYGIDFKIGQWAET